MIIAVEGIDGAGKNTLVSALRESVDAEVLAFPRYADSAAAQLASEALYGRMGDLTDSAYAMATLFALDRHDALPTLRTFAGSAQRLLIVDRYVASNAAYSVARTRDESLADWVEQLEFFRLGLPRPDLQVLLATSAEEAARRAAHRESEDSQRSRDRYERDAGLQERTLAAYRELARREWGSPWLVTTSAEDILQKIPRSFFHSTTRAAGVHGE
ncbi:dTMP kinase [Corynebacterium uropygiale]|uniref:Thymidylate kinase n=1 Tax=Corynebacterium uropygiale TaxID=1775911 RepID=A0A9X1QPI5_9CORY|nr:dTMP kinase [Corynebacterium uropygiale]MCF4006062.1 dTMP kinase [Corynebacterium uropygiale]